MIEIKVPTVGESINEVTLLKWTKKDGDYVSRDEVIAELESEKATFEVNAEQAGTLKIVAKEGDTLLIGAVLATIDETAVPIAVNETGVAPVVKETTSAPNVEVEAPAKAAGKGVIEIKVPVVGESITEVTLIKWTKRKSYI